jgi:hypothetical protein
MSDSYYQSLKITERKRRARREARRGYGRVASVQRGFPSRVESQAQKSYRCQFEPLPSRLPNRSATSLSFIQASQNGESSQGQDSLYCL